MKPSKEERKIIEARSLNCITTKRQKEIELMVYEQPDGRYREAFLDLLGYVKYLEDQEGIW